MSIAAQKTDDDRQARAAAALAEKPDGIVEAIAAKAEVTPAEIWRPCRKVPPFPLPPTASTQSGTRCAAGAKS